jgi:tetratricopeptide (TPR) repeat protein
MFLVDQVSLDKLKEDVKTTYFQQIKDFFPEKKRPKFFTLNKTTAIIFYYIAEVLRSHKYYSLALKYFNESIKIEPDNEYAYLLRGLTYYNMKNYKKAKNDWKKVIKLNNQFSWLNNLL